MTTEPTYEPYAPIPESDNEKVRKNSPYWADDAAHFARRRRIYLDALLADGFTRDEAIALIGWANRSPGGL